MPVGGRYFFFLELPFSPDDFDSDALLSEDLESDGLESDVLESEGLASPDFSADFADPSPELSFAGAPDFFPA